jgi:hypothetical protein
MHQKTTDICNSAMGDVCISLEKAKIASPYTSVLKIISTTCFPYAQQIAINTVAYDHLPKIDPSPHKPFFSVILVGTQKLTI